MTATIAGSPMKRNLLLLLLPGLAACTKNDPQPAQDISGDYPTDVHYLHTWIVSQNNYGTVLDTNYTSNFHIEYHNDTLNVSYTGFDGATTADKLVYNSIQTSPDTLRFSGPWNGYSYANSYLTFYKSSNRFKYTRNSHTNPSGGGNDITYTIQSR